MLFLSAIRNILFVPSSKVCVRGYCIIKSTFPMDTAYFRHMSGENEFHVSFRYKNITYGVDKQLNFCRKIDETCDSFLNRVNSNVTKLFEKKGKRKKSDVHFVLPEIKSSFLCNGAEVPEDTPLRQIVESREKFILKVVDSQFEIGVNLPWVETITLPNCMMEGFRIYPSKLQSFFVDRDASMWTWMKSKAKGGPWTECGHVMFFIPLRDDIEHFIKLVCLPRDENGREGPAVEAISTNTVGAAPGDLPFEVRHAFTRERVEDTGFRAISYNVLADLYVDSEYSRTTLFGYCPAYALELAYRKQLLLKELVGYNGDLVCLQEVDSKVFRFDLEPLLKYEKLVGEHSLKGSVVNEGTAIFFNTNKFRSLKSWRIVLGQAISQEPLYNELWQKVQSNEPLVTRFSQLGTSLQVLLLESLKNPGQLILVGNTHLYFHPDADHIRLLQGVMVLSYLQSLLNELQMEYKDHALSLLLCGDFNSVPECGIYKLLTTGSIENDFFDWRSNEIEAITDVSYDHPLKIASACGTPLYTNYTPGFKACIDYIFYQKDHLEVEQVIPFPSEEELAMHGGIPSIVFPSDHVALVSDLKWKTR